MWWCIYPVFTKEKGKYEVMMYDRIEENASDKRIVGTDF